MVAARQAAPLGPEAARLTGDMGELPVDADSDADSSEALAAAARAGPFFGLEHWALGAGWRPLGVLVSDLPTLRGRVTDARAVIAARAGLDPLAVEERVAASVMFLGLAARLLSPSLGAAVITGMVPCLGVGDLWWRPARGAPWPMAAGPAGARKIGDLSSCGQLTSAAALLAERCVQGVIEPVTAAFAAAFGLSLRVLRGNVASALAGAAGMLAEAVPDRAEAAGKLAGTMLTLDPLRGTGELVQPDVSRARWFLLRNSCCLLYRVPGAGTCGDCVLTPEAVRRQQWQAALRR
jgi:FhuF 2Fe-2S C-terminal domain